MPGRRQQAAGLLTCRRAQLTASCGSRGRGSCFSCSLPACAWSARHAVLLYSARPASPACPGTPVHGSTPSPGTSLHDNLEIGNQLPSEGTKQMEIVSSCRYVSLWEGDWYNHKTSKWKLLKLFFLNFTFLAAKALCSYFHVKRCSWKYTNPFH